MLSLSFAALTCAASADDAPGPLPDGHAPAGVMVDHMHKAGEFMIGYRYMYMRNDGDTLHGTSAVDDHEIMHNACLLPGQDPDDHSTHNHCSMKASEMTMRMHMLDIMYAPTDWLTLMVMPQWMTMDMDMVALEHDTEHMGHSHGTDGLGDTIFGALIKLSEGPGYHIHTGLMFSAPTGSVSETAPCHAHGHGEMHEDEEHPEEDPGTCFTHYHMQLGSGTWDFLPSLTYTGSGGSWSWGAQASGVIRMEVENESGFAFGNIFQATAWTSYRVSNWLSVSTRLLFSRQGIVEGHYNGPHNHNSPPDLQGNYGGRFWDAGFGINTVVPSGFLKGHRFSAEWLEPVHDDVNGYQLERDGTLWLNWSKAF
jgi:hypothetical protein